jgi:hypothetical protein
MLPHNFLGRGIEQDFGNSIRPVDFNLSISSTPGLCIVTTMPGMNINGLHLDYNIRIEKCESQYSLGFASRIDTVIRRHH